MCSLPVDYDSVQGGVLPRSDNDPAYAQASTIQSFSTCFAPFSHFHEAPVPILISSISIEINGI